MQSLNQFCSWSKTWQLTVAYSKCSVISFGSHGYEPTSPYSLSGIPLQFVSSIRDLGVCLNSDLTPSMHCSNIAAMAFNRSCLLHIYCIPNSPHIVVQYHSGIFHISNAAASSCNIICYTAVTPTSGYHGGCARNTLHACVN